MANCKACKAEIVWIKTDTGKNMPLDAEPEKMYVRFDVEVVGRTVPGWKMVNAYRPHWGTCPQADKFRKGG